MSFINISVFILLMLMQSAISIATENNQIEQLQPNEQDLMSHTDLVMEERKRRIHEMRCCIEICTQCISDEYYGIETNYACIEVCLNNRQRLLDSLFKWWLNEIADFESSVCLIDLSLNRDLRKNVKR